MQVKLQPSFPLEWEKTRMRRKLMIGMRRFGSMGSILGLIRPASRLNQVLGFWTNFRASKVMLKCVCVLRIDAQEGRQIERRDLNVRLLVNQNSNTTLKPSLGQHLISTTEVRIIIQIGWADQKVNFLLNPSSICLIHVKSNSKLG